MPLLPAPRGWWTTARPPPPSTASSGSRSTGSGSRARSETSSASRRSFAAACGGRWLAGRLEALLAAARDDAEGALGVALPREPFDAGLLAGEEVRLRLPQDMDAAESVDERERIADLATEFLGLCDELARHPPPATD